MQHVAGDPAAGQLGGEVVVEHDLREFAPLVGGRPVVRGLQARIVEVDRRLRGGGHVHDSGGCAFSQARQQSVCQVVAGEIVHRQPQFDAVAADLTAGPRRPPADSRVVHERVELVVGGQHLVDHSVDVGEVGQFGEYGVHIAVSGGGPDLLGGFGQFV